MNGNVNVFLTFNSSKYYNFKQNNKCVIIMEVSLHVNITNMFVYFSQRMDMDGNRNNRRDMSPAGRVRAAGMSRERVRIC